MNTAKLESLVVFVPGEIKSNPLEQAQNNAILAAEVSIELKRAIEKCQSINQIDDNFASVVGLKLSGKNSVETFEIKYVSSEKAHTRNYSKKEFYTL